jgi:hypothetical protein
VNADTILDAMADAYANCISYHDSGHVLTRFFQPDGSLTRKSERPFRTAFVRPDRFRFEFRRRFRGDGPWHRFIIWADGSVVQIWSGTGRDREQPESIGLAIAAGTGVSGGSAHTMPTLLMPDRARGRRLTDLAEPWVTGEYVIAETPCYRLTGKLVLREPTPAE